MPLSARLALTSLLACGVVYAATSPQWVLPWTTVARSALEGHAGEQNRRLPQAIAFTPSATLLISDTFNRRVLSAPATALATVELPGDLAVHADGRVLVADRAGPTLRELGPTPRTYGEKGPGPLQLLDVARVAWGPSRLTAAADDLGHHIVLFDDARPTRSIPYDSYGFAFDPHGHLVTPRFATLSGFVLARQDATGHELPALPLDLASPLAIELLEVAADGTALVQVPDPSSMDGRQELLSIEPGGRAHTLWTGHVIDAARSFARHLDGTLYRASETPAGLAVAPLEPTPAAAATGPTTAPLRHVRELCRIPADQLKDPVALVARDADVWLIAANGRYSRFNSGKLTAGQFQLPAGSTLGAALPGAAAPLLLCDAHEPILHATDPAGAVKRTLTLEGWSRAPDLVTVAPGGQLLAHDRAAGFWVRHDAAGKVLQRFDGAGSGALDVRSELITVQDTDEPYSKVVMQFDCNGNFFKAVTTFKEATRPTGARFAGTAPGGDLVIGYWLGTRGVARRISIDGAPRAAISFNLPASARTAVASWALDASGDLILATREGTDTVLRSVSW